MQTQYLPQVLACLVQPLAEDVEALSLPELTHALKTCFKVLSKVQMPPSYLDAEATSRNSVRARSSQNGPEPEGACASPGAESNPGSISIGVRTGRSRSEIYNTLLKSSLYASS